ncbi:MAG: HAMP domain-containing protein, partial [Candidatus Omnitrophica bacterium]|nr:HAMP domain-containing protein [Candidatus Omnitrophota bacterium]
MNIGERLKIGFGVLAVLLILVGIIAYFSFGMVGKQVAIVREHADEIEILGDLQYTFSKMLMPANDYIFTGDVKYKKEFDEIDSKMEDILGRVEALDLTSEDKNTVRDIKKNYAGIKDLAQKIFAMEIQAGNLEITKLMEEMDYKYGYPTAQLAETLHDTARKDMDEAFKVGVNIRTNMTVLIIVSSLISILVSIFLGMQISRSITRPVRYLVDTTASVVTTGDLSQEIKTGSDDEVGELAKSFSEMMKWVKDMSAVAANIAEGDLRADVDPKSTKDTFGNAFKSMIEGLRQITSNLINAIAQITSASNQILAASQEQASGAREQSSAVAETTSAAKELSMTSEQVGDSIK